MPDVRCFSRFRNLYLHSENDFHLFFLKKSLGYLYNVLQSERQTQKMQFEKIWLGKYRYLVHTVRQGFKSKWYILFLIFRDFSPKLPAEYLPSRSQSTVFLFKSFLLGNSGLFSLYLKHEVSSLLKTANFFRISNLFYISSTG